MVHAVSCAIQNQPRVYMSTPPSECMTSHYLSLTEGCLRGGEFHIQYQYYKQWYYYSYSVWFSFILTYSKAFVTVLVFTEKHIGHILTPTLLLLRLYLFSLKMMKIVLLLVCQLQETFLFIMHSTISAPTILLLYLKLSGVFKIHFLLCIFTAINIHSN